MNRDPAARDRFRDLTFQEESNNFNRLWPRITLALRPEPPYSTDTLSTCGPPRSPSHETHIPAEPSASPQGTRFPRSHENAGRPSGNPQTSSQGPQEPGSFLIATRSLEWRPLSGCGCREALVCVAGLISRGPIATASKWSAAPSSFSFVATSFKRPGSALPQHTRSATALSEIEPVG